MSYAIIRNTNYKMKNLSGIYRHNERKNTHYSNKDILKDISHKNYSIKQPTTTYEKTFKELKNQYNLKGQIKSVSNVACEFIITSDKEFFDNIGEEEMKRYFKTAYDFVAQYQNLGEQYILSAKVHLDESTPHLHIVFIPVVHKKDKTGKSIDKIACSEFWKGKNSYEKLQNSFYKYISERGFDLERGKSREIEHLSVEKYKEVTNYEEIKQELKNEPIEELDNTNMQMIIAQNKNLKIYVNKLKSQLIKYVKTIERNIILEKENQDLIRENQNLQKENILLQEYINKTYKYISLLINIPVNSIKKMLDGFIKEINERKEK